MPDDLLHRPAPDLISDSVLAGMEQDGWTPTQVRALIASYRLLARDVLERQERVDTILAMAKECFGEDDIEYSVTLSADLTGNGESYRGVDVSVERDPLQQLERELRMELSRWRGLEERAQEADRG